MSIASVLTIYPTALKVEDVLKARARAGDVSLGHRLTTFPELVAALDRESIAAAPVVDDALALVLVQEALADARLAERPGLARAVLRAVGELKAAGLGPSELATLARTARGAAPPRLAWLARLAAAYADALARIRGADRHDRERRVLELLHRHEREGTRPRALAGAARLVVAEIYDYSPLQSLIVSVLIRLVGDAQLVTLAHPENVDAARFVERTWNRFVEDPAIADKVLPDFVVRGGRGGALAQVLATLFVEPKPPGMPVPADDTVTVIAAATRAAEVDEVARRVHASLAAGTAPDRIAVLIRDVTTYRPLLEDAARRLQLPLSVRRPRPLASHALVQLVLRIVRTVADGLPRDALRECLESPYLTAAPRRAARLLATVGYVDAATRPLETCVADARARSERLAAVDAPERGRHAHARALSALQSGARALVDAVRRLRALDEARPFAAHARRLLEVVGELGLAVPGTGTGREEPTEGVALATIAELLERLASLAPALDRQRLLSPSAFLGRLLEAVETVEVDVQAPALAGVRALAIADARGLDFDEVYVLGLDDGSFPAPVAEDPILDDALRREVNRLAPHAVRAALAPTVVAAPLGRALRSSAERAAEDPFLFYLALSTAERRVVITYPTRDDDGHPRVRSPFVDEVLAVVGEDAVVDGQGADAAPPMDRCREPAELLRTGVARAVEGTPGLLAALRDRFGREAHDRLLARTRVERRRARYFLLDGERDAAAKEDLADAFVGRLAAEPALRTRLRDMDWSASGLEELGACGFKFFAHRLLRLAPDAPASEGLDVREEGTLVHRLLERLLRHCDPLPGDPQAAAAAACAFAAGCRDELEAEVRAGDPHLFELAWSRAVAVLLEMVRAECAAPPQPAGMRRRRLLEWPFRFTLDDHRTMHDGEPLDLTLTGVIDRADLIVDGDGRITAAQVIDYKNSKRESEYAPRLDPERAMGVTGFQIPVYALGLLAAPELTWAPGAVLSGGYLLLRADRKPVVRPLATPLLARDPQERQAAGSRSMANRIIELVASAASGRFDVAPCECSRFCDYRHICRYEPPPEEGE